MIYNIQSDKINVFPSVQRTEVESRKLTEARIVGLINRLYKNGGRVITRSDQPVLMGEVVFDIYGYLFKVSDISLVISQFASAEKIWAYITLMDLDENQNPDYVVLNSLDDNGTYYGVTFTDAEPTEHIHIELLYKENGSWYLPEPDDGCHCNVIDGGDVSGEVYQTFTLTVGSLVNCQTVGEVPATISTEGPTVIQLVPDYGYTLAINDIIVTGASFTYNNYVLTLFDPTEDTVFSAVAEEIQTYPITYNEPFVHCSIVGEKPQFIPVETSIQLPLSVDEGYRLTPSGVTVTNAIASLLNNVLTITNPSGPVTIYLEATQIPTEIFSITITKLNCYMNNSAVEVYGGSNYVNTFFPNEHYKFDTNSEYTVSMGGVDITSSATTFTDNKLVVTINNVSGDIAITAKPTEIPQYVTLSVFPNFPAYQISSVPAQPVVGDDAVVTITTSDPVNYPIPEVFNGIHLNGASFVSYTHTTTTATIEMDDIFQTTVSMKFGSQVVYNGGALDTLHCTISPMPNVILNDSTPISLTFNIDSSYFINGESEDFNVTGGTLGNLLITEVNDIWTLQTSIESVSNNVVNINIHPILKTVSHTIQLVGENLTFSVNSIDIWENQIVSLNYTLSQTALPNTEVFDPVSSPFATYTVDKINHTITISNVTTDLTLTLRASSSTVYTITYLTSPGVSFVGGPTQVSSNEDISVSIVVDEGYNPVDTSSFEVLPIGAYASFAYSSGMLTVRQITDNISIRASTTQKTYTITFNGTNVTPTTSTTTVVHGGSSTINFQLDTGYNYGTLEVIPVGKAQAVDNLNGTISVSNVTSDVAINYIATQLTTHTINYSQKVNCEAYGNESHTSSAPTNVIDGNNVDIYFVADQYYKLPSTIIVNGASGNYTYNPATGKLTINAVSQDIYISIVATEIIYHLTLTSDNHCHLSAIGSTDWSPLNPQNIVINYSIDTGYQLSGDSITITPLSGCVYVLDTVNQTITVTSMNSDCTLDLSVSQGSGSFNVNATGINCNPDSASKSSQNGIVSFNYTANNNYNVLYTTIRINNQDYDVSDYVRVTNGQFTIDSFSTEDANPIMVSIVGQSNWSSATITLTGITQTTNLSVTATANVTGTITFSLEHCAVVGTAPQTITTTTPMTVQIQADTDYMLPSSYEDDNI